jgi:hypothetical protein
MLRQFFTTPISVSCHNQPAPAPPKHPTRTPSNFFPMVSRPNAPNMGRENEGCGVEWRRVGVAHLGLGDDAALNNHLWPRPEKGGLPEHQIGQLADFDGADCAKWRGPG